MPSNNVLLRKLKAEVKETAEGQGESKVAFEVSVPEVLDSHLRSGNP